MMSELLFRFSARPTLNLALANYQQDSRVRLKFHMFRNPSSAVDWKVGPDASTGAIRKARYLQARVTEKEQTLSHHLLKDATDACLDPCRRGLHAQPQNGVINRVSFH